MDFFHAVPVGVFHVADYRRQLCGAWKGELFDPLNSEAAQKREECLLAAVQDMAAFLTVHSNGVVILDSINETHAKRQMLNNIVTLIIFPFLHLFIVFSL